MVVGAAQSLVHLGNVQRVKIDCHVRGIQVSDHEADQSAATIFRSLKPGAPIPQLTLYGLSPVVEVSGGGTLVVERIDVQGERYTVPLKSSTLLRDRFYDFAKANQSLTAGGTYAVSLGSRRTTFKIDPHAISGSAPIIGRLLRL